ncbi:vitronectin b [Echeneis naucrates]|uniref:vitronectin b n=1 Tax=Echeneis naucrates TaxID=173247 RepID=UPI0011134645|nr:vitronectin-like [Echeneis naucrates]
MRPAVLALVLLLNTAFAAEQSCVGRCGSFDAQRKCQCDSMCVYHGSCCMDFDAVCPKKARGDTFTDYDEVTEVLTTVSPNVESTFNTVAPTSFLRPRATQALAPPLYPNRTHCNGQPFDAFLQLKNESIYAFRGDYFFELDETSIVPGYPKLIQDVWGISGPIDAAFTRINCQGKSYIFKGNRYWRFDGDVLDEDYPRDISLGFDGIPDDINAAFAIPAPNHRGKEKAYFFKGDKYYQYEFKHQPSHEECVSLSRSSPSALFTQYNDLFCDQTWEDIFTELFGHSTSDHIPGPRFISRDWQGIRPPVDAAMVGRVRVIQNPKPTPPAPPARKRGNRKRRPSKRNRQRGRQRRHLLFIDLWGFDNWYDYGDYSDIFAETTRQEQKSIPVQNVYFFKRDKYYRVNLQQKRVDLVSPPYPRSIAKYWLGCKQEEIPDASKAEKR